MMADTQSVKIRIESGIDVPVSSSEALKSWLVKQAEGQENCWLLAHADDGVIWGYVNGVSLALSGDAFYVSPPFNPSTLQQARLFWDSGEILIWRGVHGLVGRKIIEGQGEEVEFFDTKPLLWGTEVESTSGNFVLLGEGEQGLRHAPPLVIAGNQGPEARLVVRNYLSYEEDSGQAYVSLNRLVELR